MTNTSLCEESGWTYQTSDNLYQVYYKEKHKSATPIYTDPKEEFKAIKKRFMRNEIYALLIYFMFLAMGITDLMKFEAKNLITNDGLFLSVYMIFIAIIVAVENYQSYVYFIKNYIKAKNNESLVFPSNKSIKLISTLTLTLFGLYVMGFVLSLGIGFVGLIAPVMFPVLIVITIFKTMKLEKNPDMNKKFPYVIGALICIFILMKIVSSDVSVEVDGFENANEVSIELLELKDFDESIKLKSSLGEKKSSIFIPKSIEFEQKLYKADYSGNFSYVKTKYYECLNEDIADYFYLGTIKSIKKANESEVSLANATDDYKMLNNSWDVDESYLFSNLKKVVLIKGNTVMILEGMDFTDVEVIGICKDKLDF